LTHVKPACDDFAPHRAPARLPCPARSACVDMPQPLRPRQCGQD